VFDDDSCLVIDFANTSVGYSGLVAWTFGDGTNGIGETIRHDYAEAGDYLVCVTVTGNGITDSACYTITVDSCITIGIGNINTLALQLYPNPAHDQLTVVVPNGTKGGKLAIVNNLGMLVKEVTVTDNRTNISISELAAGIYHLIYNTTDGTTGAGRFVKE
jgi:PKD repeat protein